jgi:hypothetical protein
MQLLRVINSVQLSLRKRAYCDAEGVHLPSPSGRGASKVLGSYEEI